MVGVVQGEQILLEEMTQEIVRLGENFVQLFPVFQGTFPRESVF